MHNNNREHPPTPKGHESQRRERHSTQPYTLLEVESARVPKNTPAGSAVKWNGFNRAVLSTTNQSRAGRVQQSQLGFVF